MLFVGGPCDGTRTPVPGKQSVVKFRLPPDYLQEAKKKWPQNLENNKTIYVRRTMTVPGGELTVYSPPDMKPEAIMNRLIFFYQRYPLKRM